LAKGRFTGGNAVVRFPSIAHRCGYPPCGFSPPGDQIGVGNRAHKDNYFPPRTIRNRHGI